MAGGFAATGEQGARQGRQKEDHNLGERRFNHADCLLDLILHGKCGEVMGAGAGAAGQRCRVATQLHPDFSKPSAALNLKVLVPAGVGVILGGSGIGLGGFHA